MLFVESHTLSHEVNTIERIQLLEELQKKNLTPLIRSAKLNCFSNALLGPERVSELETAMATSIEAENQEAYVRGDVFCLADHVFFLVFDDQAGSSP